MDFLKNNPRFSFLYGEKHAFERAFSKSECEKGDTLTTVYDFENGLRITNAAKKYGEYDAYEWVNFLENTGKSNTELISALWDCDVSIPFPREEKNASSAYLYAESEATVVICPNGSNVRDDDFGFGRKEILPPGKSARFRPISGRSSDGLAPFWNVHHGETGFIAAIGWSGQWNCVVERTEDFVNLRAKIEDTRFALYPGERIRTCSIVIMRYEGSAESAHNKWRRFLRKHFSPIVSSQELPLSLSVWGGMRTERVLERLDAALKSSIPADFLWMDAGWYGANTLPTSNEFDGDWATRTGDYRVSPHIHPNGMRDIRQRLGEQGKSLLLWLEPERVMANTPIAQEHPEYFISSGREGEEHLMLDLGNEYAFRYCLKMISELIEELDISCYRQDFNFYPLSVWRRADKEDRAGITEIKHIMGLYRLWDELKERFPHLLIDNCASGGKRIDIETLKRSVPLWRSDAYCHADYKPETSQSHLMNYSLWMPYSGTGSGRGYDAYRLRSAYAPSMRLCHSFSAEDDFCGDAEKTAVLRDCCEEYLQLRKYFDGDIHLLTKPPLSDDVWCAAQWSRPELGDGMIQIFAREESVYKDAVFKLSDISEDESYVFRDLDGGEFSLSGKYLEENGFPIHIEDARTAKIFIYRQIKE